MGWLANQPQSTMAMVQLIESIVFSEGHDAALRNALKAQKGADVVLTYPTVAEDLLQNVAKQ